MRDAHPPLGPRVATAGPRAGQPLRWLKAAIAGAVLATTPAQAAPDQQIRDLNSRLVGLEAQLAGEAAGDLSASSLIAAAGLPVAARPAETGGGVLQRSWRVASSTGIEVQRMNMRLALTMLAQAYGAEDNGAVLGAQTSPELEALVIRKGNLTLADLRMALRENRVQRIAAGGPLTLTVPLVIGAGASLNLQPGDAIELSRTDGAFIVNFGHLQVQGGSISSVGAPNPRIPSFMPFVTTADGGSIHLRDARLRDLGFGETMKFSGVSVMGSVLRIAAQPSVIEDSRFDNLLSVSVSSSHGFTLRGNRFRDMRGAAVVVSQARDAQILSNLFSGRMPTNAIRVENGSAKGNIAGNVILDGERAGIVVRNDSNNARISDNIVWHRKGGGIAVLKSDCALINGNTVIHNSQKGIEIRSSEAARVEGNTLLSNHSAGLWVSAQPKGTQTRLTGNVLIANGSGIATAAGEKLLLEGNDFTGQFPQFLGGDLTVHANLIALNLDGQKELVLTAAGMTSADPAPPACAD